MSDQQPRLLGVGYAVPQNIRTNDDPIFDWLKAHPVQGDPFQGYVNRVVLGPGEDLMTMMVPAAVNALTAAGLRPSDVDMLLGYASVSAYQTPNELSHLHHMLGCAPRTYVVPLNSEFSNFNAGLLLADALVRAGRARNVLVVVGGNWTRHVDYHTVQAVSAADGAGAAIVGLSGDDTQWRVVDQATVTDTSRFGSMYMQGQRYQQQATRNGHEWLWSDPFFHITPEGFVGFGEFGGKIAPGAVLDLLSRHHICAASVTLIAHQASSVLLDAWRTRIAPAQIVQTIEQFANMTVANIPVNFAWSVTHQPISQDNLVLFALAPDMHANALLLQRQSG